MLSVCVCVCECECFMINRMRKRRVCQCYQGEELNIHSVNYDGRAQRPGEEEEEKRRKRQGRKLWKCTRGCGINEGGGDLLTFQLFSKIKPLHVYDLQVFLPFFFF